MTFKTFTGAAAAAALIAGAAFADGEEPAGETVIIIDGERVDIPSGAEIEAIVSSAIGAARAAVASGAMDMDIDIEIDGQRFEGSDRETLEDAMSALEDALGELEADMPRLERELRQVEIELREAFAEVEREAAQVERRHIRVERRELERAAAEARRQGEAMSRMGEEARRAGLAAGLAGMEAGLAGIDSALESGMVDDRDDERPMTEEEREAMLEARAELLDTLEDFRAEHAEEIEAGHARVIVERRGAAAGTDHIRIEQENGRTRYYRNGEELTGDELTEFLNDREAGRLAGAPEER